jgi:capsular polysaccharide transport system permease protein
MTRGLTGAEIQREEAGLSEPGLPPQPRRRRRSTLWLAALPALAAAIWLHGWAADQYISEFRFTVRQQQPPRSEAAGSALAGGNPMLATIVDSEVVVQYLRSRQVLDDIAPRLDLDAIYARPEADWWARLREGAPAEERLRHWRRMVEPQFDLTNGIVTVRVHAFTPAEAQAVAATALDLSERLVNAMSQRAAEDALAFAAREVAAAEARLKAAQADIAAYRNSHAVLFPQLQAATSGGVEGRLREALAEARAAFHALQAEGVARTAPQMRALQARVQAIEAELRDVQGQMARREGEARAEAPLASVLRGYSALEAEERLAAGLHERAVANLQAARAAALQQRVYLNAFVRPATPETSLHPRRWRIILEALAGGLVVWCLGALIARGIRDQMA